MTSAKDTAIENYYQHCYPCKLLWKWLSCIEGAEDLVFDDDKKGIMMLANASQETREVAFQTKDGHFRRNLNFKTYNDMRDSLLKEVPAVIQLGAVYLSPTSMGDTSSMGKISRLVNIDLTGGAKERLLTHEMNKMNVSHRELVFDVDMSDYDGVIDRSKCDCKESNAVSVCKKCWIVMKAAIQVLNNVLTKDFGFRHVYFFYSGRRGFHCWVTDFRARCLSKDARSAIVDWMYTHVKNGATNKTEGHRLYVADVRTETKRYSDKERRTVNYVTHTWTIHPSFQRDLDLLMPMFRTLCTRFELCRGKDGYNKMLDLFLSDPQDRWQLRIGAKNDPPVPELNMLTSCMFGYLIHRVRSYLSDFSKPTENKKASESSANWRSNRDDEEVKDTRPKWQHSRIASYLPGQDDMPQAYSPNHVSFGTSTVYSSRKKACVQTVHIRPRFDIVTLLPRIVFHYLYPRLDKQVTIGMTHLAKSPFAVHKDTRQIAVAISNNGGAHLSGSKVESFDPRKVPTVDEILSDLDSMPVDTRDSLSTWEHTRLAGFVRQFANNIHVNTRK